MAAAILNFFLFEASWLAAAMGGAGGWPLLGSIPAVFTAAVHLYLGEEPRLREAGVILAVTLLGLAIETGFIGGGLITYAGTSEGQILPPIWILAMWLGFGTMPHSSLRWLSGRWKLQVLLGAVFGPLSYLGGAKLGAATLPDPSFSALVAIGIGWALAMPAIFLLAETINGRVEVPART